MAYATLDDLLQVEPTIQDYGILDWDAELARSEQEVNRIISVRWWSGYAVKGRSVDITHISGSTLLDPTKLDPTQWTMATVYHAMAYHICPKLTKFEPDHDRFQVMMDYYAKRFEHEMDLCLREGVRYDENDDGEFSDVEKQSDHSLRLRR
jgi:hypothetical protein